MTGFALNTFCLRLLPPVFKKQSKEPSREISNFATSLKWSWGKARKNILPGAVVGAIAGFAFKVPYEVILNPYHFAILDFSQGLFPWQSIYRGMVFGLSTGLLFGFIRSWTGPGIRRKATLPNQGIRQSAKHSLWQNWQQRFAAHWGAETSSSAAI